MPWLHVLSVVAPHASKALERGCWLAIALLVDTGCGSPSVGDDAEDLPGPTAGYPAVTSRLTLRLAGEFQKLCHATLIAPGWALTAAHCFSSVAPDARGALNELGRSLSVSDVSFHPGALRSGQTRLETVLAEADFVAAHDLALIPVVPTIDTVLPPARWLPEPECALPELLDVRARFGQLSLDDRAQTAQATLLGTVSAASLLGPGQPGSLLSATGASVHPGDSGSGVLAASAELLALASGCAHDARLADDDILMGVIQDANPDQPDLPFGLIPLHVFDHARWIAGIVDDATPPAIPERPRLDP